MSETPMEGSNDRMHHRLNVPDAASPRNRAVGKGKSRILDVGQETRRGFYKDRAVAIWRSDIAGIKREKEKKVVMWCFVLLESLMRCVQAAAVVYVHAASEAALRQAQAIEIPKELSMGLRLVAETRAVETVL